MNNPALVTPKRVLEWASIQNITIQSAVESFRRQGFEPITVTKDEAVQLSLTSPFPAADIFVALRKAIGGTPGGSGE